MSLCLASAGAAKSISVAVFMLTFTSAADQGVWQEDWRVTPTGLQIVEARMRDADADRPAEARLSGGWYRWTPRLPVLPQVVLANSSFGGDWRLCSAGTCQDLSAILGGARGKVTISARECSSDTGPKALDAKMLLARGDDFNTKGDPDRAIADYDAALKADPAFAEALNSRAMAWRAKGDRRRALSDLDAALRLKPDFEAARANRKSLFSEIERLGAQMPLKGKSTGK